MKTPNGAIVAVADLGCESYAEQYVNWVSGSTMASSGSTDTGSFLLRGILNSYFIEDKDDAYYDILWRFVIWDEDLERCPTIDWYHHA